MCSVKMWKTQIKSLLGVCPPVPGVFPSPKRKKRRPAKREDRTKLTLEKVNWALKGEVLTSKQVAEKIGMDEHYIAKLLRLNPTAFYGERRKVGGCYKFFWRLNGQDESEEIS